MTNLASEVREHGVGYADAMSSPKFIIVSGPNGSGKSTSSAALLPDSVPYINADEIAKALPNQAETNRDMEASRLLLRRWDELAAQGRSFAIETTLSSRSLASRIHGLGAKGYEFHLLYFWLESVDLAVARVAARVQQGGHNIPEDTIRRRYVGGLRNLFGLYMPLANTWEVYNNTAPGMARKVAEGSRDGRISIDDFETWNRIKLATEQR